jgi:hypothetical protein
MDECEVVSMVTGASKFKERYHNGTDLKVS